MGHVCMRRAGGATRNLDRARAGALHWPMDPARTPGGIVGVIMSTSTPKNVPSTTPTGPEGNAGKAGSAKTPKNGGATEAAGSVEAGGSAATSGAAPTPERVYVKLPAPVAG